MIKKSEMSIIDFISKKKALNRTLQALLAVMLFFAVLAGAVFAVLAFKPLYYLDIDALDIPAQSGYSREKIVENYDALIDYNLPLTDGTLEFPSLKMSDSGRKHFAEVKDIFDAFKILFLVLAPLCVLGVILFHRLKNREYLLYTAIVTVALPLVGGGLIALNWESVFVNFHKLFFDNDDWIFNPRTDPVITILPDEFFMHCAIAIISIVLLFGGICFGVWLYKRTKERRTEKGTDVSEAHEQTEE